MTRIIALLAVIGTIACRKPVRQGIEVPVAGPPETPQAREQERFDQRWRQLQSFRAQQAARQAATALQTDIRFVNGRTETFKGLDANAINSAPVNVPITGDVQGPSVLKTQVYLDRAHFSVGPIDGRWGKNSSISVWWWQWSHGIPPTGDVDETTFRSLAAAAGGVPAVVTYQIMSDDVKGPFVHIPDDVYQQEKLSCLCYQSIREELAERFHATEDFLGVLNPELDFSSLQPGQTINVPNVRPPMAGDQADIAQVVISIAGNTFNAFDAGRNLIFHAPTTVGSKYDPSPEERLDIVEIVHDPHFHYDPTLYSEVPDANPDAHLEPGPNSPVGVVWMALSKEHYGIHGTSDPQSIGYASSHGCIRLTNWDAAEVAHRVSKGTPVMFVDVRR